ncbi:hypothetical protein [Gordonia terrae]|uniref:hypothetical protein n=1 Tax=Gordonia terrae TaxID=2055 RepID=UPI003F6C2A10
MTTRFDGRRSRHDDLPLAALPAWGLEMMMGLYGPETIRQACADEAELGVVAPPPQAPEPCRRDATPETFNQVDAELEAINSLLRYLGRKLRRS